jgi:hypothetical protein
LHFIAPGLGQLVGTVVAALTMDKVYAALSRRNGGIGVPEYRVPMMMVSSYVVVWIFGGTTNVFLQSILVPTSLFLYGWCADQHTHWISLDIGAFIFGKWIIVVVENTEPSYHPGFATTISFMALSTYMLDAFKYPASAVAATSVIRSIAGALFPLVQ